LQEKKGDLERRGEAKQLLFFQKKFFKRSFSKEVFQKKFFKRSFSKEVFQKKFFKRSNCLLAGRV